MTVASIYGIEIIDGQGATERFLEDYRNKRAKANVLKKAIEDKKKREKALKKKKKKNQKKRR